MEGYPLDSGEQGSRVIGSLIIFGMVILCITMGQPWLALVLVIIDRLLDRWQNKGR